MRSTDFLSKNNELAKNHLTENGSLYFEIHNEQGEKLQKNASITRI